MDIGFIFEGAGKLLVQYLSITFTLFGVQLSVGSVVLWSLVAALLIKFLHRLGD